MLFVCFVQTSQLVKVYVGYCGALRAAAPYRHSALSDEPGRPLGESEGETPDMASRKSSKELDGYSADMERATQSLLAVTVAALESLDPVISTSQIRALLVLEELAECGVSELATALDVFPSSASRLADRLTASGLISRVPAPDDRRAVRLALTGDGRRVVSDFHERRNEAFAEISALMTAADRRRLLHGLQAFSAAHARISAERSDRSPA